ncbi:MAG: prepilin peptidase [Clostridia bacterium]|nr:prepilin peptidase [Clostridia bacterium]
MMAIVYIFVAILGLCVGSFLNVLIYRVPNQMSIIKPDSHCPNCKKKLKWWHNIPVLSWLCLGGRCAYCRTPISPRYIMVEILNMVLWLGCALVFWKINIVLATSMMIGCSILITIAFIDFEHKYIPDRFQIALLIVGILCAIFDPVWGWASHVIGLFVGGGVLLLFYGLGFLLYKKEALGFGDVKLMAVCGLILGWQSVLVALFFGAILGAIGCLIMRAISKDGAREYAFAPYLALGVILAMFFGADIVAIYLGLF